MAAQQMYMFPEERIAKLEQDINVMRRSLYARVTAMEKVVDGNTLDFIEIKRLLEEAKEAVS